MLCNVQQGHLPSSNLQLKRTDLPIPQIFKTLLHLPFFEQKQQETVLLVGL